jgi:aromatic-L-amino-acid decarboxylase
MTTSIWPQLAAEIEAFTTGIRELPVMPHVSPAEVREELETRYTFEEPVPLEEVTADVTRLLRAWTVHVTHPRYFGLFNPSVRQAGIVADTLAALYNPQLAAWSHAPAANEIERLTLRCFSAALGFDPDAVLANFTTGGAEANLSAVLVALAHRFPEAAQAGIAELGVQPTLYLTGESHHSFVKIARMAGLGTDALREISTTDQLTLDVGALRRQIQADTREGRRPLMIVGTAGTTGAGVVDPLPELAEVAAEVGAWFHVDAAWGGAAVLSPRLRPVVAGIERADSVTWDAHKWLSVPMGAGMFFCRHPEAVKRAFAISTSYMPGAAGGDTVDPYATTAQWSRRAIGLKVFMSLAELGIEGYGELIDHQARMGDLLRERLRETGWVIMNETPLPVICFTHPDIRAGRLTTGGVLDTIYERQRVWISNVVLGGEEPVLRACITSFRSDESDIACLLEELEYAHRLHTTDSGSSAA